MIKVAICDNDVREVTKLKDLLTVYDDFDLHTYSDPQKLSKDIETGNYFDIYFLEIIMTQLSGLDMAKQIKAINATACIIFITSSEEFALKAYEVRAFQYFVKPINTSVLYSEIDFIMNFHIQYNHNLFAFKTPDGLQAVPFHKIAYLRVENRCIICVQSDGRVIKGSTLRIPFAKAIIPLLKDRRFVQTHISFAVNLYHVSSLLEQDFMMTDKTLIPIAQNSFAEVKERYLSYLIGATPNTE